LPLTNLAQSRGFLYTWVSEEGAALLTRPGVTILVRAGNRRYEVNDAVRYLDETPTFRSNDILMSGGFDGILARLAFAHPWPTNAASVPSAITVSTPLTASTAYRPGTQTIEISGRAAAGIPVTVTLSGEISRDLPVVTIDRVTVTAGSDGTYVALIPAASISFPNSMLTATVTAAGAVPISARIGSSSPNPTLKSLNDELPNR
jgi:hypothetical protein